MHTRHCPLYSRGSDQLTDNTNAIGTCRVIMKLWPGVTWLQALVLRVKASLKCFCLGHPLLIVLFLKTQSKSYELTNLKTFYVPKVLLPALIHPHWAAFVKDAEISSTLTKVSQIYYNMNLYFLWTSRGQFPWRHHFHVAGLGRCWKLYEFQEMYLRYKL